MPASFDSPVVAIVVPLYKHSVLVGDALASALAQEAEFAFCIIVVNDGCPFLESDLQVKSIASARPNSICYLVQKNRGLSAARNAGIDYALKHFPSLSAIYFLDADNMILPRALANAYQKLQSDPDVSWVYPNIDMFGLVNHFDYSGPYSLFRHAHHNICEAGSLVHRRVFDAGIRFDETMRQGYEDWDFWLTAAEQGFRGVQLPHFGFRYRNRGESMLSQAHRDDSEIQARMKRKHPAVLGRKGLLALEAKEAPRYAIFFSDTNEVLITSADFDSWTTVSQEEFQEMLWRNIIIPSGQYVSPFFVFMTKPIYKLLEELGLLRWVLYDCESTLKTMNIACLMIATSAGNTFEVRPGAVASESDVVVLTRDLVCASIRDVDTSWIEKLLSPDDAMRVATKTLVVPHPPGFIAVQKRLATFALLLRIRSWRASHYRSVAGHSWIWRESTVPPPHALYFHVRAAFGGEVTFPATREGVKNIGFVLPIVSAGGVERVAYNVAQEFVRAGWRAHLFVVGQTRIDIPDEFASSFASINFLNDEAFGSWDAKSCYQGTDLSSVRNNPRAAQRLLAALTWLDVVVNCHCGELNAVAAELRQIGIKMIAHLHLLDMSRFDRSMGHPMLVLAYEHAYDLVICNSKQLLRWMHGAGIPEEKLVHVANAPGHPIGSEVQTKVLARRQAASRQQLNALYLGRLDRQKGIGRLAEVIQHCRTLQLPIDWRVVGSGVIDIPALSPIFEGLLEPPVFDSRQIAAILQWADVLVLLSDYEGVPLSILEAQRLGVVVIATNVGAIPEIIANGRNGFLVERDCAVDQTVKLLELLIQYPEWRLNVAFEGARVPEWREVSENLINQVSSMMDGRQASAKKPSPLAKEFSTEYAEIF